VSAFQGLVANMSVCVCSVSKPSYLKDILPLRIDAALSASQSYSGTHGVHTYLCVCVCVCALTACSLF